MKTYIYALVVASIFFVAGCSLAPVTIHGAGSDGGASPAAFATCPGDTEECSTNIELANNCGGCGIVCSAGQVCGIGCGESYGCYTPGGNPTDPGPSDCPSCYVDADAGTCAANYV